MKIFKKRPFKCKHNFNTFIYEKNYIMYTYIKLKLNLMVIKYVQIFIHSCIGR